jgi:hypothetical protein
MLCKLKEQDLFQKCYYMRSGEMIKVTEIQFFIDYKFRL